MIRFKSKRFVGSLVIVLAIGMIGVKISVPPSTKQDSVREREYVAKNGNITVGIETSGLISTASNNHMAPANAVIEDVYVRLGSEVKKGDKLAEISIENLDELIKGLEDDISDAKAALMRATSEKDLLFKEHDLTQKNRKMDIEYDYYSRKEALTNEKSRIEKKIETYEKALFDTNVSLEKLAKEEATLDKKIQDLKLERNSNNVKIGELNERILKVDTGSSKHQALNRQVLDIQYEIQALNKRLNDLMNLSAKNLPKLNELEEEIKEIDELVKTLEAELDETTNEDEKNALLLRIKELKNEIQSKRTEMTKLSYTLEIESSKKSILNAEYRLKNTQKDIHAIPDGSSETLAIRLNITELENANMALNHQIDAILDEQHYKVIDKLRAEKESLRRSINQEYEALTVKNEEIQRLEVQYQYDVEKNETESVFSDYRVSEEIKRINDSMTKANRQLLLANEKVDSLNKLKENPVIYSEMDGVVTAVNYRKGDTVMNGKPVCTIGNLADVITTVPVNASDISSITVGQKVRIYAEAYAERTFEGTVIERFLVANDNGDFLVTIKLDSSDSTLLPGMKIFATIILKEKLDVLTISNRAIMLENGIQYVNKRNASGVLERVNVVTGFSDGRISEVLSGLSENDTAVIQE